VHVKLRRQTFLGGQVSGYETSFSDTAVLQAFRRFIATAFAEKLGLVVPSYGFGPQQVRTPVSNNARAP
jgi:hypothetical protein